MSGERFLDLVLNLGVFAFIGLLIWLYFKPETEEESTPEG